MTEPNAIVEKMNENNITVFRWYSENESLYIFFTNWDENVIEKSKTMFKDIVLLKSYKCIVVDMYKQEIVGYNPQKYIRNKEDAKMKLKIYHNEVGETIANFKL